MLSVFEKNKRNGFIRFICLAGAVIFSRFTSDKSDTSVSFFYSTTESSKETEVLVSSVSFVFKKKRVLADLSD